MHPAPQLRISDALLHAAQTLGSDAAARADATLLLAHVLQRPRPHVFAWPEQPLTPDQGDAFEELLARRAAQEPIAYLTGRTSFWSFDLEISAANLVPRPETELLVELSLERAISEGGMLLDLGTGAGPIALAFALERPTWQVVGTDCSLAALCEARGNANRLGIENVDFLCGYWMNALRTPLLKGRGFDLVVSNPPYIEAGDPDLDDSVRLFEPARALYAEAAGLGCAAHIISRASGLLIPGGALILEHGWRQREAVLELLRRFDFSEVQVHDDFAGLPRAICATWRA